MSKSPILQQQEASGSCPAFRDPTIPIPQKPPPTGSLALSFPWSYRVRDASRTGPPKFV